MRKILSCCLSLALAGAVWSAHGASAESVQERLDKARAAEQEAKDALAAAQGRLQDVLDRYSQLQIDLDATIVTA